MKKYIVGVPDSDRGKVFDALTCKNTHFKKGDVVVNNAPEPLVNFYITENLNLKPGQKWFVKLPGNTHLSKGFISVLTKKVVVLEIKSHHTKFLTFKILDIEFIEEVIEEVE